MLEINDIMMVQWMCNVTMNLKERKSSDELRDHLGLVSIRNNWIDESRLGKDSCVNKGG